MIGYITLGTNDLPRAVKFYDDLFAVLGVGRAFETDRGVAWGKADGISVAIMKPFNGEAATVGNGSMAAFSATNAAQVNAVFEKAISLGAKDEGAPGLRGANFYGAYFRDLDGNKLCAFCMNP